MASTVSVYIHVILLTEHKPELTLDGIYRKRVYPCPPSPHRPPLPPSGRCPCHYHQSSSSASASDDDDEEQVGDDEQEADDDDGDDDLRHSGWSAEPIFGRLTTHGH